MTQLVITKIECNDYIPIEGGNLKCIQDGKWNADIISAARLELENQGFRFIGWRGEDLSPGKSAILFTKHLIDITIDATKLKTCWAGVYCSPQAKSALRYAYDQGESRLGILSQVFVKTDTVKRVLFTKDLITKLEGDLLTGENRNVIVTGDDSSPALETLIGPGVMIAFLPSRHGIRLSPISMTPEIDQENHDEGTEIEPVRSLDLMQHLTPKSLTQDKKKDNQRQEELCKQPNEGKLKDIPISSEEDPKHNGLLNGLCCCCTTHDVIPHVHCNVAPLSVFALYPTIQIKHCKKPENEFKKSNFSYSPFKGDRLLIPPIQGAQLLKGIDFETFQTYESPFSGDGVKVECIRQTSSQKNTFKVCKTAKEFSEPLTSGAQASFKGFGLKAVMTMADFKTSEVRFQKNLVHLFGGCVLDRGEFQVVDYPSLEFNPNAFECLKQNPSTFRNTYGTHCIIGYRKGGSGIILGTIYRNEQSSSSSYVTASLETIWNAGFETAEAFEQFIKTLGSSSGKVEVTWVIKKVNFSSAPYITVMGFSNIQTYITDFSSLCGEDCILCYIAVPYTWFRHYNSPTPIGSLNDLRLFNWAYRIDFMYKQSKFLTNEKERERQYLDQKNLLNELALLLELFQKSNTESILDQLWKEEETWACFENEWDKAIEYLTIQLDTTLDYFIVNKYWKSLLGQNPTEKTCLEGTADPKPAQGSLWNFIRQSNGSYVIKNKRSGDLLCLKLLTPDEYFNVTMYQVAPDDPEIPLIAQWNLELHDDESYTIMNKGTNLIFTEKLSEKTNFFGYWTDEERGTDTYWFLKPLQPE